MYKNFVLDITMKSPHYKGNNDHLLLLRYRMAYAYIEEGPINSILNNPFHAISGLAKNVSYADT